MSHTARELLIIYETEAEQWAAYLKSVFTGPISEAGICCYDIATASGQQDDFLRLARYSCKLLILSKGMLDGLGQKWCLFLARVLSPAGQVVVLLCGVESLTPLLELVPLNGDEFLQITSEQDAHEYLSTVTDIVRRGVSASAANVKPLTRRTSGSEQKVQSAGVPSIGCRTVVVPTRVPCGTSTQVFILLKSEAPGGATEVEFAGENRTLREKPVHWNDRTLCVTAPDFPAGIVGVTVHINGVPLSKAQLQYYSSMEEIAGLLTRVADPIDFMCQALQVSSVDKLDDKLSFMLLKEMPTGGFPALQCENTLERELHHADLPTLLHFAAQYGLKGMSGLLLQCPGAGRALRVANCRGQTPAEIARSHGHAELHVLLRQTLNVSNPREDNAVAGADRVMRTAGSPFSADMQEEERGEDEQEEVEDPYTLLRLNDDYDTIVKSTTALVIANRPPAPTPRPECAQVKDDRIPYITQVFQKKKTQQQNPELCSLSTKQARGRGNSISSYEDDDSVYDKINIVHHAPSNTANESRRGSQELESGFYSKPLKGKQLNLLWRAYKQ